MWGVLIDIHLRPKVKCGCVCHCTVCHEAAVQLHCMKMHILHTNCHMAATGTHLFQCGTVAVLRDALYRQSLADLEI
jgi:hypothetical protein